MGLIRGSFSLSNPTRPDLAPLEVSARADSGAVHLCIPEHLVIQLSLAELERREVVLADGHRRTVPYEFAEKPHRRARFSPAKS